MTNLRLEDDVGVGIDCLTEQAEGHELIEVIRPCLLVLQLAAEDHLRELLRAVQVDRRVTHQLLHITLKLRLDLFFLCCELLGYILKGFTVYGEAVAVDASQRLADTVGEQHRVHQATALLRI